MLRLWGNHEHSIENDNEMAFSKFINNYPNIIIIDRRTCIWVETEVFTSQVKIVGKKIDLGNARFNATWDKYRYYYDIL